MKVFKYLLIFASVLILSSVGFWYLGRSVIEDHLKKELRESFKLGDQKLEIKKLKINSLYPLKVQLSGVSVTSSAPQQVSFERIDLLAKMQKPFWEAKGNGVDLNLHIDGAQLEVPIEQPWPVLKAKTSKNLKKMNSLLALPVSLKAFIKSSQFHLQDSKRETIAKFDNIHLGLEQKLLLVETSPIVLDSKTDFRAKWGGVDYKIPLTLSSKEVFFHKEVLSAKNVNMSFSGLNMMFKEGFSNFGKNEHEWSTHFEIADLGKLPTLPDFLPAGQWEGSLKGQLQLRKSGGAPPFVSVSLVTSPVKGQISVKNETASVEGVVDTQMQLSFVHFGKFKLDALKGHIDLSGSKVSYLNFLDKPAGVSLGGEIHASFKNEILQVESLSAHLHNLKLNIFGKMGQIKGKSSALNLSVEKTSLSGFEKYLPLVSSSPLSGFIDLEAEVGGNLSDFPHLNLKVIQFHVQDVAGFLEFADKDHSIKASGPFRLNVDGSFNLVKSEVDSSQLKFSVNADQLNFEYSDKIQKKTGAPLRWSGALSSKEKSVTLSKSSLKTSGLSVNYEGEVSLLGETPEFDLKLDLHEFNKSYLEKVWRRLQEFVSEVTAKGKLRAKGAYAPDRSFENWPLKLEGDLVLALPLIKIESDFETENSLAPSKGVPPPPPILAGWEIFQHSDLFVKLYIDKFIYNKFLFEDARLDAIYKSGNMSLKGRVNKAYDGHLIVDSLSFDALKSLPDLLFSFQFKNFNSQRFINENFENHKDTVQGRMNLTLKGKTPYPYGDWLENLVAKGSVQIKEASFPTFRFDDLANESLAKIPGLGAEQNFQPRSQKVFLSANYSMAKGRVFLKKIDLQSSDNSQAQLDGVVDLDLNCKFDGRLALSRAMVRGSAFAANKDAANRFVAPVTVRGNLLQPNFIFSRETVDELLSKALKYETNLVQVKAKTELDKRAEQEELERLEKKRLRSKTKSLMEK